MKIPQVINPQFFKRGNDSKTSSQTVTPDVKLCGHNNNYYSYYLTLYLTYTIMAVTKIWSISLSLTI